jgi:hypothetical protein
MKNEKILVLLCSLYILLIDLLNLRNYFKKHEKIQKSPRAGSGSGRTFFGPARPTRANTTKINFTLIVFD